MNWSIVAVGLSLIAILLSVYQFHKSSLLSKPSFYIDLWKRMGETENLELKILERSNTDYFLEDVSLLTESGEEIHLDHNYNRHRILVTIPDGDYMFGLKCRLIIRYRLKNNSRYQATSPELILNNKFSKNEDFEHYLNIVSEVTNKIFE
ncbi:hypothetical protein [Sporosarcina limicola]|uniref:Uncharacterized protein n=1 Tax=Sporosarcina limicola TaxID=34101 RepID=A0A927MNP5_9BACL|nr:hypothetical protein [Sporosarcina limicola]MBE1554784.1 hypothetical protein [Sporosarcina limicola]